MSSQWYYQLMGEMVGPVSASKMRHEAQRGIITRDTLVRKGEDTEWILADRVKDLFEPSNSTTRKTEECVTSEEGNFHLFSSKAAFGKTLILTALGLILLSIVLTFSELRRHERESDNPLIAIGRAKQPSPIDLGVECITFLCGVGLIVVGYMVCLGDPDFAAEVQQLEEASETKRNESEQTKLRQDAQIACPQCQKTGNVATERVKMKKGLSGGKTTAAVLTGGFSLLAVGLSRKEELTKATCSNCGSVWHF